MGEEALASLSFARLHGDALSSISTRKHLIQRHLWFSLLQGMMGEKKLWLPPPPLESISNVSLGGGEMAWLVQITPEI